MTSLLVVTPPEAERIARGAKTQHRIPHKRMAPRVHETVPVKTKVSNPHLGYDVMGEPKIELITRCRIFIRDVRPGMYTEATLKDARAEGFKTLEAWRLFYGNTEDLAWVLDFEVDRTYRPRFLSARVIAGTQGDYVENPSRAMAGEMEAVDEATLNGFALEARVKRDEQTAQDRAHVSALTLPEQLNVLATEARARHIDVRDEVRKARRYVEDPTIVRQALARMRTKLGHA